MNYQLFQAPASNYLTGGYLYNKQIAQDPAFHCMTVDGETLKSHLRQVSLKKWVILDSLFLYEPDLLPYLEGIRLLWLVHDLKSCDPSRREDERDSLRKQEECYLKKATGIMATSQYMADQIKKEFGLARVGFARPGHDLASLEKYRQVRATRRSNVSHFCEILSVGHVIPRKGYWEALHCIHHIKRRFGCKSWRWRIVGNLDHEPTYIKALYNLRAEFQLEDQVEFLGLCSQAHAWELMAESDFLWLPSRFETFGMVVTEALRIGLPVVASKIGELPNLMISGINGYLYDPADTRGQQDAIAEVLRDPAIRQRWALATMARQDERSWQDTIREWHHWLAELNH